MEYRFDPYTRSFSAVYPEYYDAYYSAEDEEEAARRARKRRRIRNLAIGAGAAAALAGGGLLYLRHKGRGSIGDGWKHVKDRTANKISGGAFDRAREDAFKSNRRVKDLEKAGINYQKLVKAQNSKIRGLEKAGRDYQKLVKSQHSNIKGLNESLSGAKGQVGMYKSALSRAMGRIRTGHFSEDEMYY